MKINKILISLLVLVVCASLALSAAPKGKKYAQLQFHKGDKFLTPQIGLNSYATPFGASFEYAITENIGVGGTVMIALWNDWGYKNSLIMPAVEGAYHFTKLKVEKLDLFAGLSLGYAIFNSDYVSWSSGLDLSPFIAARYWFSDKIGVSLKVNYSLFGDFSSYGTFLGVVFRI